MPGVLDREESDADQAALFDATAVAIHIFIWLTRGCRLNGLNSPQPSQYFSTASLPIADRFSTWREVFGQKVVYLDIEPVKGAPFHADGTLCALPGAAFSSVSATPIRVSRTQGLIANDKADTLLVATAARLREIKAATEREPGEPDLSIDGIAGGQRDIATLRPRAAKSR